MNKQLIWLNKDNRLQIQCENNHSIHTLVFILLKSKQRCAMVWLLEELEEFAKYALLYIPETRKLLKIQTNH